MASELALIRKEEADTTEEVYGGFSASEGAHQRSRSEPPPREDRTKAAASRFEELRAEWDEAER